VENGEGDIPPQPIRVFMEHRKLPKQDPRPTKNESGTFELNKTLPLELYKWNCPLPEVLNVVLHVWYTISVMLSFSLFMLS